MRCRAASAASASDGSGFMPPPFWAAMNCSTSARVVSRRQPTLYVRSLTPRTPRTAQRRMVATFKPGRPALPGKRAATSSSRSLLACVSNIRASCSPGLPVALARVRGETNLVCKCSEYSCKCSQVSSIVLKKISANCPRATGNSAATLRRRLVEGWRERGQCLHRASVELLLFLVPLSFLCGYTHAEDFR